MSIMVIRMNGAFCCGMASMYIGNCPTPDTIQAAMNEMTFKGSNSVYFTQWAKVKLIRPEETAGVRAEAFIQAWKNRQANGILEVVVAQGPFTKQYDGWAEWLKERGFVEVSSCFNSNSYNRIHVFHLINDKE